MKKTFSELKKDSSTVIVGDFNNSLFIMIRINRQKVNKEADE